MLLPRAHSPERMGHLGQHPLRLMRDSSPSSPQCDIVDEKESPPQRDAYKAFRANPFPATSGKDKSGDCVCTTELSRFAYRHNNESSLITIQF